MGDAVVHARIGHALSRSCDLRQLSAGKRWHQQTDAVVVSYVLSFFALRVLRADERTGT
ncbi:hypothetical protein YSA_03196 [Pseudomonas putida ND6]|uniref:Uncharacterized protein n=1 Tax=Pseudomonas putida ND6 TaxID=231023 RepID=I3USN2_PSEPU|nr:hypothetical protein YSA_03196 [Pseudomonas putida ND6]